MAISDIIGIEEFKTPNIWKALCAEFLGTAFLVLVGCGSATGGPLYSATHFEIAFCFGLIVATMVHTTAHISGGHINPAVTMGMLVVGRIKILRGILYIIMQCLGAIIGAAVLTGVLSSDARSSLGQTNIESSLSAGQGLGIEILITFVLVFTVFAVVDPNRTDLKGSPPITIGLSVAACHLWAIRYTGASMNTARSFGPAVVGGNWENHWIYWIGPLLGGIIAGLLYDFLFSAPNPSDEPTRETSQLDMNQPVTKA